MRNAFKYFIFVVIILSFTQKNPYSQWTFCSGSNIITQNNLSPSISVVNKETVWVSGGANDTPAVYLSTNGGDNFTNVTGNMVNTPELICICGIDANTAYAGDGGSPNGAGGNAKVWKTTNGGITWNVIFTTGGTFGFINGITFSRVNPLIGVIESDPPAGYGTPYWIQKTTNGGITWQQQNPPGVQSFESAINTVNCIDNNFYGFGLAYVQAMGPTRVYISTNNGSSWTASEIPFDALNHYPTAFTVSTDKLHMLACALSSLPEIGASTNGGNSWQIVNTNLNMTGYCSIKYVYGTSTAYLAGDYSTYGCAAKSTDDGMTWVQQTTSNIIGFRDLDLWYDVNTHTVYAYAVAYNGKVVKLMDAIIGIERSGTNIPKEFFLEQNYPNPFNPGTKIKFDIRPPLIPLLTKEGTGVVSLKIYNSVGEEITTLVNEILKPGSYEITWNAANYPSGVYFYKLVVSEAKLSNSVQIFSETKKMVLVK